MTILVIQTTDSGVYYHRQFIPHYYWNESSNDHDSDLILLFEYSHLDKIINYVQTTHIDIVFFSVVFAIPQNMSHFIEYMKFRGSKIVVDVDDRYKNRQDVAKALSKADAVTTVSETLAKYLFINGSKKYPYVIENGIYSDLHQFKSYPVDNDDLVFGYLGSTKHEQDLKIMDYDFSTRNLFVVCEEYASMIDVNIYTTLKSYRDYAWEYNAIDVALAPLQDNLFNQCKSFLKVIEAGFKKKAIICSDVEPYNRAIHNEFRSVVDYIPVGISWKDRIESYTKEESLQRGEELFKLVQPFEIRNLNKKRREIYQQIINTPK